MGPCRIGTCCQSHHHDQVLPHFRRPWSGIVRAHFLSTQVGHEVSRKLLCKLRASAIMPYMNITEADLRHHYEQLLWSDKRIADKYGVDNGTIARLRHRYTIPTIDKSTRSARKSGKPEVTESVLRDMYVAQRMTTGEIATALGLGTSSITRFRKEWGIPTLDDRAASFVGKRFNRLVVQSEIRTRDATCQCLCDCGKVVTVKRYNLESGATRSCGCYNVDVARRPDGMSVRNTIMKEYQGSAGKKGLVWDLSDDQAFALFQGACFYCGVPPSRTKDGKRRGLWGSYTYNGIDRRDSSQGYVIGNVVSCCTECNYAKGTFDLEDFIRHVGTIRLSVLPYVWPLDVPQVADSQVGYAFAHCRENRRRNGREIPFTLTRDQVITLVLDRCHYCGAEPTTKPIGLPRNGIDRLDSARGYETDNVVPCCWMCNKTKGRRSVSAFLAWVGGIRT